MTKHSASKESLISKDYKRTSSTPSNIDYVSKRINDSSNRNKNANQSYSSYKNSNANNEDNDDEDLEEFYNKLKKNKVNVRK